MLEHVYKYIKHSGHKAACSCELRPGQVESTETAALGRAAVVSRHGAEGEKPTRDSRRKRRPATLAPVKPRSRLTCSVEE
ncbi:hypothetical protein EVAR_55349_1 [Eumeta japonica]|uniref:Uncharacterized protein n=1 Tax=Eumeta variegata TaxID=151549 RepID=A0A4C1YEP3_EUMVA|nr:hypothetical protein EVAR_55349_1 [Eumeta japonica]